jgi:hypothetical protein
MGHPQVLKQKSGPPAPPGLNLRCLEGVSTRLGIQLLSTGNSEMDHAEQLAQHVLEGALLGTMEYQSEQSHGEYDFKLHYENGITAAVEVTSSIDRKQTETIRAIQKKGNSFRATKCRRSWLIFPVQGARLNKIWQAADENLSKLEQAGFEEFHCVREWDKESVQDVCRALRVTSGYVIHGVPLPMICVASPGGGGAVDSNLATEAGEIEAWKQDNRKKLGTAQASERHLVVYIDVLNGRPWVALTDFEPPFAFPNLPPEITHIWLVGHGNTTNELIVWRASQREPWSSLHI